MATTQLTTTQRILVLKAIAECETKSAAANETLAVGSYKERCDKADVIRVSNDQRRALVRSLGLGLGEKLARGEAART